MKVQVLAVLPGRMAVVSTKRRVRIVESSTGRICRELLHERLARGYCEEYLDESGIEVVSVGYESLCS